MGTPQFSCPTLEKLLSDKDIEVIVVYTKEPSIAGRGQKVTNSKIHELALKNNLKILTPKNFKNHQDIEQFLEFKADVAIVVAYGLILPKDIINGTKFGCINLHPSLLPKWRGAAPIQRTIMNGDKITATTVIKMDEGIDSGDIINQEIFTIDDDINYNELAYKFAHEGAELVVKSLKELILGKTKLTAQNNLEATYAKKIEKDEAKIDWNLCAKEISQKIRGLSGNIGAFTFLENDRIKITQAKIIDNETNHTKSGKIINNEMHIACKIGTIQPVRLQKSGKKEVDLKEFLLGNEVAGKELS